VHSAFLSAERQGYFGGVAGTCLHFPVIQSSCLRCISRFLIATRRDLDRKIWGQENEDAQFSPDSLMIDFGFGSGWFVIVGWSGGGLELSGRDTAFRGF
jgi:hypothetical protein